MRKIVFQFQSGAVKSIGKTVAYRGEKNFNSKVVRLKANALIALKKVIQDFNSKVVRLKVGNEPRGNKNVYISIPKWCG